MHENQDPVHENRAGFAPTRDRPETDRRKDLKLGAKKVGSGGRTAERGPRGGLSQLWAPADAGVFTFAKVSQGGGHLND